MIAASLDLNPLTACFRDIGARAANWRRPLDQSGVAVRASFEQEWAQHGPGWAPNAKGSNAMRVSGDLYRSFTKLGAKGNLARVTLTTADFGSVLSYAAEMHARNRIARNPSQTLLGQLGRFGSGHFTNLAGAR